MSSETESAIQESRNFLQQQLLGTAILLPGSPFPSRHTTRWWISDVGSNMLLQIPTLKHLAIWHGVESWKRIAQSESLQVLLIDDSVKDLSPLHKLRQLKVLLLSGEDFSSTEVARLRLTLPECRIKSYRSLGDAICDFRSLSTRR